MNVLAKLLAGTDANLVQARQDPSGGAAAQNGAFRSLLERIGIAIATDARAAPDARAVVADGETPETRRESTKVVQPRRVAMPATGERMNELSAWPGGFKGEDGVKETATGTGPAENAPTPPALWIAPVPQSDGGDAEARPLREEAGLQAIRERKITVPAAPRQPITRDGGEAPMTGDYAPPADEPALASVRQASGLSRAPAAINAAALTVAPRNRVVAATVIREETHLPPARPTVLPSAFAAPPVETKGTALDHRHGRDQPVTERLAEAEPIFHGGRLGAEVPSLGRAPADQENPARAAFAAAVAGAPAQGASTAGLPAAALQDFARLIGNAADSSLARATAPLPPTSVPAASGPVRGVALKLEIPDHGVLNVRMSLNGRALSLHLRAERDETAHRLRHDREALCDLLRQGGYEADVIVVDGPRRADMPAQAAARPESMSGGSERGRGDTPSGGDRQAPFASRQQSESRGDHFQAALQGQEPHETNRPNDRGARALYV